MSRAANRAAWSPEERAEFDELVAEVIAASTSTADRLDLMDAKVLDAVQAHRPWATEFARAARREGYAREIRRHQDRVAAEAEERELTAAFGPVTRWWTGELPGLGVMRLPLP